MEAISDRFINHSRLGPGRRSRIKQIVTPLRHKYETDEDVKI